MHTLTEQFLGMKYMTIEEYKRKSETLDKLERLCALLQADIKCFPHTEKARLAEIELKIATKHYDVLLLEVLYAKIEVQTA